MGKHDLFKGGVKPAILVYYKKRVKGYLTGEDTPLFVEYRKKYPYIIFKLRNSVLFFQTEEAKNKFMKTGLTFQQVKGKVNVTDYNQGVIGEVLGYPPLAVKAWEETYVKKENNVNRRARINYFGLVFVCYPEDVRECIEWLLENRRVPNELAGYEGISFKIQ